MREWLDAVAARRLLGRLAEEVDFDGAGATKGQWIVAAFLFDWAENEDMAEKCAEAASKL